MINIWRIPLLFYVSGMRVGFAIQKRNLKQLLGERARRILIPLLFGMIFIVPLHILLWQKYYNQDITVKISPGHLWFLANIFILRLQLFNLSSPNYLVAIESNLWIFALLGLSYRYLNKPGKILKYLSQAAYPVYILHMLYLYLASFLIVPLHIPAILKFITVIFLTVAGCFITYEYIIRRITIFRVLFGLRRIDKKIGINLRKLNKWEISK